MKARNKYIPVFLLFLFLFPLVEIGIHDFSHRNDSHCLSNQKHFHQQEHNCSLCDYNTSTSDASLPKPEVLASVSFPVFYSSLTESEVLAPVQYNLSPRAPPELA